MDSMERYEVPMRGSFGAEPMPKTRFGVYRASPNATSDCRYCPILIEQRLKIKASVYLWLIIRDSLKVSF